jgi:hypothetical protein
VLSFVLNNRLRALASAGLVFASKSRNSLALWLAFQSKP